jgi:hypothetical protein
MSQKPNTLVQILPARRMGDVLRVWRTVNRPDGKVPPDVARIPWPMS